MGFIFNDITSASMGIKARLTSWQVCGKLRNFTTTVPGKYGVADFGADFDYREIKVQCNVYPKHSFTALVSALDDVAAWLDPVQGLRQLVLDDVPDRYFMARLNDAVDCERLIRSAGSFELKFFCPDPFGYAITDETFSITEEGVHTITRSGMNPKTLQYLMGHSEIGVTLNTYTHLGLDDATDELKRVQELEDARKEQEKLEGKKPVSQKMFRAI